MAPRSIVVRRAAPGDGLRAGFPGSPRWIPPSSSSPRRYFDPVFADVETTGVWCTGTPRRRRRTCRPSLDVFQPVGDRRSLARRSCGWLGPGSEARTGVIFSLRPVRWLGAGLSIVLTIASVPGSRPVNPVASTSRTPASTRRRSGRRSPTLGRCSGGDALAPRPRRSIPHRPRRHQRRRLGPPVPSPRSTSPTTGRDCGTSRPSAAPSCRSTESPRPARTDPIRRR